MTPKVLEVAPLARHQLKIKFETGETKIFDVSPYISGHWFGQLQNEAFFASVRPRGRTVEWAGGQDVAPHELYEDSVPYQEHGRHT